MRFEGIRGFNDILPSDVSLWQRVESKAREVLEAFGFREVRTPVVERSELYARSIGETTDIVEKEMYTFPDRRGTMLTLRPEATAGIMRAYVEHKLFAADEVAKLYSIGAMFRYERPQKGRYRQFHQIDAEVIGVADPLVDAEVLRLLMVLFGELNISGLMLQINSLGCGLCRPGYREALVNYLEPKRDSLCDDCRRRISVNPLRVLDCKVEPEGLLSYAPAPVDHLCRGCKEHFEKVKEYLEALTTEYRVNPRMVRGLDYYVRTTFELTCERLGAQNAVAAGGRYDGLVKDLGGPDVPGLGFAIGMERVISLLSRKEGEGRPVFVVPIGEAARKECLRIATKLMEAGVVAELGYGEKSLKSQLRRAQKLNSSYALIVGEEELASHLVVLKDMDKGTQERMALEGAIGKLKGRSAEGTESG